MGLINWLSRRRLLKDQDDDWQEIVTVLAYNAEGGGRDHKAVCAVCGRLFDSRPYWENPAAAEEMAVLHRNLHRGLAKHLQKATDDELRQICADRMSTGDVMIAQLAFAELHGRSRGDGGTTPDEDDSA